MKIEFNPEIRWFSSEKATSIAHPAFGDFTCKEDKPIRPTYGMPANVPDLPFAQMSPGGPPIAAPMQPNNPMPPVGPALPQVPFSPPMSPMTPSGPPKCNF